MKNCPFCGASITRGFSHCPECRKPVIKAGNAVENGKQPSGLPGSRGDTSSKRRRVRLQKAAQETPDTARRLLEHTPTIPIESISKPLSPSSPAMLLDEMPTTPTESIHDHAPTIPTESIHDHSPTIHDSTPTIPTESVHDVTPTVPTSSVVEPAPPTAMPAVPISGRLGTRAAITARQGSRHSSMTIVLLCLVVLLVGGAVAGVAFLRSSTQVMLPPSALDGSPTPVEGPSGQVIDLTAGAILNSVNLASRIDSNYLPVVATTTFAPGQKVYLTFIVNSQNQPGYIMVKWYANNRLLAHDQMAHNPQDNVAFFSYVYGQSVHATVELYWCANASCSDSRLAHVIVFTVQ